MLRLVRPTLAMARRQAAGALARRGVCSEAVGLDIEMCALVLSCKVAGASEEAAHRMDMAYEDFLDAAADVDGVAGASRLVCTSEWDYKIILKFEDHGSLVRYLGEHHDGISSKCMPAIEALAADGHVRQQSFVYDDVE